MEINDRDFFKDTFTRAEIAELLQGKPASEMFNFRSPSFKQLGLERDKLSDNELIDLMLKEPKIGDYTVTVVPEPNTQTTDTYSLKVFAYDQTIILASDIQIDSIPSQGYIVKSSETGIVSWNYFFEDPTRGAKLYLNTADQTFQFITPDKEFPIKKASKMRVIDRSGDRFTKYDRFSKKWRFDTRGLGLDSELDAQLSEHQFVERPKKTIIIFHQDEELRLSAIAIDGNMDFCTAHAKDVETGKRYLLVDKPGVESIETTIDEPEADFTASRTEGRAPLIVRFTDKSTGDITGWLWDFGDGKTSTRQNPLHVYRLPGNYTVTLTVSGPGGSDMLIMNEYISVESSRRRR